MFRNGFTLIELIIVMALIALASALALPLMSNSLDRLRLNSASREMAALFRQTRNQAVSQKEEIVFELDFSTKKYSQFSKDSGSAEAGMPMRVGEHVILKGFAYSRGESFSREGIFSVTFFPQGNSTGGIILLGASEHEGTVPIEIDRISGRVRIRKRVNN